MVTFHNVFITVGTTSFDALLRLVVTDDAIKQFKKWQVKKVLIQGGKNTVKNMNKEWVQDSIEFEMYDYKTSIREDLLWADLIICHGGAGTTIEALDMGKTLLVVPNESLMDNHQGELTRAYKKEGYAFVATLGTFFQELTNVDPSKIKPFPPKETDRFVEYVLTKFLGVQDKLPFIRKDTENESRRRQNH